MDNFNLQSYIKSGKLHSSSETLTEAKKQGYDDREDESLGARDGAEKDKKQSMKDRRDDSYGKFGKRDAEKKGKNKINKESISETIAEAKSKIDEGSYPFDQCLSDNEGKYGKKGAAKVCGFIKAQYGEGLVKENEGGNFAELKKYQKMLGDAANFYRKKAKELGIEDKIGEFNKGINDFEDAIFKADNERSGGKIDENEEVNEDARTDAEQEGYKDGFEDAKDDVEDALKKMKVSELKDKIKTEIVSALSEAEEDVDVDIDVEDEVEVEAGADDIKIERPGRSVTVGVGLSPEEEVVQDSLKAAMDAANQLGNDKLADQIGNTITFFTREFVVGNNTD